MAEEKKKAAPVKNTNAVKKEEKKLGFSSASENGSASLKAS